MKKVLSTTAIALATAAWAGTAGAQVADTCVLNPERFVALDRDGDGTLGETEYTACAEATATEGRQALRDQFATIDRDRDMRITRTEAEQFLAEAPQDADMPPTDAPTPGEQAGMPEEHATSGPGAEEAPPATAEAPTTLPSPIPAPPMGQREVTRGPLPLTPGAQPGAQGAAPSGGAAAGGGQMAAISPPARVAADPGQWQPVIGAKVTNLAGESLGEFTRIVTNRNGEHGAVIESGGFLGFGASQYVVPLEQLQIKGDGVVLNMPKQDLKQLPKVDEAEWQEGAK